VFFIHLRFGFKIEHRVNAMFYHIVEQMEKNGEVDTRSPYPSLKRHNMPADFKFVLLHSRVSADTELNWFDNWVVRSYRLIKRFSLPAYQDLGLEMANVEEEIVPIILGPKKSFELTREF
jgi:KUP system potassium uptake protein